MHAWESIQTTLDEIEEHLGEEIQIDQLAELAHLSKFYYQRLFKRLVHKSVMEYIKLRRLAKASEYLEMKKEKILDVALSFGFENHETFSRSFKEAYGITPESFRRNPVILNHIVKPELVLQYVMVDEDIPLITDHMILEISRKVLENDRYFLGYSIEVTIRELMDAQNTGIASVPPLWKRLHDDKQSIPGLLPNGLEIGALYMGDAAEGNCIYTACAEVERFAEVEEYTSFILPAQEYLICGFEAESEKELYDAAVYKADQFTARWMEKHNLVNTGDFALEVYVQNTDVPYLEHWSTVKER